MIRLNIPEMTCGHCKAHVEKAVRSVDATAQLTVDLELRRVEIETSAATESIEAALKAAGYDTSRAT